MSRILVNGIRLNVEEQGSGPALLMLHGFTGDVSTWEPILPTFAGFRTIQIDLIGHGGSDSPPDAERYSMTHAVEDIIGVLDQLGVETSALLGYSLGGRVALHLATAHPERFWALMLESASPGIETQAERHARVVADNKLADDLLRDGIEAFVDRWQSQALFASQLKLPDEVQANQRGHRVAQNPLGMANSLRGMGAGTQDYLVPLLSSLPMPTFLTAGELDTKYTQLTHEMAEIIPGSAAAIVPGAGHAVHLEQPESFERMMGTFLMLMVEEEAHKRELKTPAALPAQPATDSDNSHHEAKIMTSTITPAIDWQRSGEYEDIIYETADHIAKITINRPHVRNAFRPLTVTEMQRAFRVAHEDDDIGVIVLTGAGDMAFCSGGDQKIRGDGGYVGDDGVPRLNVLELQRQIRLLPKPVVAMVAGYAIGGGHVLHLVCDLTIAADNAIFGQTGPKVGSFDGGYGATMMARIVGHKKAREIWFLCRQYNAQQALDMGLINTVVPLAQLEAETVQWCKEMLAMSPTALRFLKASFNADTDGLAGIQQLAGDATLLYYLTEEAKEGRDAFVQKRKPDFSKFPKFP